MLTVTANVFEGGPLSFCQSKATVLKGGLLSC